MGYLGCAVCMSSDKEIGFVCYCFQKWKHFHTGLYIIHLSLHCGGLRVLPPSSIPERVAEAVQSPYHNHRLLYISFSRLGCPQCIYSWQVPRAGLSSFPCWWNGGARTFPVCSGTRAMLLRCIHQVPLPLVWLHLLYTVSSFPPAQGVWWFLSPVGTPDKSCQTFVAAKGSLREPTAVAMYKYFNNKVGFLKFSTSVFVLYCPCNSFAVVDMNLSVEWQQWK